MARESRGGPFGMALVARLQPSLRARFRRSHELAKAAYLPCDQRLEPTTEHISATTTQAAHPCHGGIPQHRSGCFCSAFADAAPEGCVSPRAEVVMNGEGASGLA